MHEAHSGPDLTAARNHPSGAQWYVAHTHPRAEAVAVRNLNRQGFKTFFPLRSRTIRHARQLKTIKDAYFPQYVFVALDLEQDRWRCVYSTVGIANLVSARDRPLPVRREIMESLMSATELDGVLTLGQLLKSGQQIRVLQGPFAEFVGKLDQVSSAESVYFLLSMMGREVAVKVSRGMIRAI